MKRIIAVGHCTKAGPVLDAVSLDKLGELNDTKVEEIDTESSYVMEADDPLVQSQIRSDTIKANLVRIANDMGDCDDAADLAEAVALIDRLLTPTKGE